jgi:hypothetical protein
LYARPLRRNRGGQLRTGPPPSPWREGAAASHLTAAAAHSGRLVAPRRPTLRQPPLYHRPHCQLRRRQREDAAMERGAPLERPCAMSAAASQAVSPVSSAQSAAIPLGYRPLHLVAVAARWLAWRRRFRKNGLPSEGAGCCSGPSATSWASARAEACAVGVASRCSHVLVMARSWPHSMQGRPLRRLHCQTRQGGSMVGDGPHWPWVQVRPPRCARPSALR